jgi:hypothetical protein
MPRRSSEMPRGFSATSGYDSSRVGTKTADTNCLEDMVPKAYDPKDTVRLMAEIVAFITDGMYREAPATKGSNKRKT